MNASCMNASCMNESHRMYAGILGARAGAAARVTNGKIMDEQVKSSVKEPCMNASRMNA